MEAHGSLTENIDRSKDLSMGLTNGVASGNVFVSGYKDGDSKAFPRPTGPSFAAAGANLGVQTPDTVGARASTAYTPIAKIHEHSVGGNLNLHKTPTSSLDFNVGARQTTSPFGRGQWQPNGALTFRKQF